MTPGRKRGGMRGVVTYRRLGTMSEARDALGLPDNAAVIELVLDRKLYAERDDPERPNTWIIYQPEDNTR